MHAGDGLLVGRMISEGAERVCERVCAWGRVCVRSVLGEACASALDRASEGEMRVWLYE